MTSNKSAMHINAKWNLIWAVIMDLNWDDCQIEKNMLILFSAS